MVFVGGYIWHSYSSINQSQIVTQTYHWQVSKIFQWKDKLTWKYLKKNPDNFNFQWPVCHLSFQKLLEPTNFNFFEFETMNERMLTLLWMKQQHLVLKLLLIHLNEEHSKQFANNLHRLIPVLRRHTELWLHSCRSFSLGRSITHTRVAGVECNFLTELFLRC